MRNVWALTLILAGLANASTMTMTATDLGGGDYLIELVQSEFNPTGSGGAFTIPIGGWQVSEMKILQNLGYDPITGALVEGWSWGLAGWADLGAGDWKLSLVPNIGEGTPGVGSVIGSYITGPNAGQAIPYTSTASFVLSTTLSDPPEGYKWEYSGDPFGLFGQWDGDAYTPIPNLEGGYATYVPILVPIPEPISVVLLGLGGLIMMRKRATG